MKNIKILYLNFFSFLVVKVSVYLNKHVFVIRGTAAKLLICGRAELTLPSHQ